MDTDNEIKAVVMFSGGKGSFLSAQRAAERFGADKVVLLFADTLVEDLDVYDFIKAGAAHIGSRLVTVADGRTPFQVFQDKGFLGNSRLAHCSEKLKIIPCRKWVQDNAPADAFIVVGIDWMEAHRVKAIVAGYAPRQVWAPLCDKPHLLEKDMLKHIEDIGLKLPHSYAQGFGHANCMQQGCVRGGQAYWKHYLRVRPAQYAKTEQAEQDLRAHIGKDVTMLKQHRGGVTQYITLREFRKQIERAPDMFEGDGDWGGCGCFIDEQQAAPAPARPVA